MKGDDEHGPLVVIQVTGFGNRVIGKISDSESLASHCLRGESERLPGVADIVQAITIGAITIFPGFAPGDGGENENQGRGGLAIG